MYGGGAGDASETLVVSEIEGRYYYIVYKGGGMKVFYYLLRSS